MAKGTVSVKLTRLLTCYRCRHSWRPEVSPVARCPKCKSRYWHQPRPPRRGRPAKKEKKS